MNDPTLAADERKKIWILKATAGSFVALSWLTLIAIQICDNGYEMKGALF